MKKNFFALLLGITAASGVFAQIPIGFRDSFLGYSGQIQGYFAPEDFFYFENTLLLGPSFYISRNSSDRGSLGLGPNLDFGPTTYKVGGSLGFLTTYNDFAHIDLVVKYQKKFSYSGGDHLSDMASVYFSPALFLVPFGGLISHPAPIQILLSPTVSFSLEWKADSKDQTQQVWGLGYRLWL